MTSVQKPLLITLPFTQLNTPYPATMYLKGFLNTISVESFQVDLGIEVIIDILSKNGLTRVFKHLEDMDMEVSDNAYRINILQSDYIQTIDSVIEFLQNKNPTLAHEICSRTFLPEANRFAQLEDLEWAFGTMGIQDKARHLATLYLEDIGDLIKECIDPHFGFSRYAERLGRTASSFDELNEHLNMPNTIITDFLVDRLEKYIQNTQPTFVCLSVPFPGNLFAALKCGQHIKKHHPDIKVVMGGGYANTELRSVSDPRVFDYVDFISLDDGEAPLMTLIQYLNGERSIQHIKRMFARVSGEVVFLNGAEETDIAQKNVGTPDYGDLNLTQYLSVIEVANPMHRMWSDGRWNKLTLAHGCYWGRCTFCDISLDYIKKYDPLTASMICDRMETIIAQTGQNGFHFVDEAAPPSLLFALSLEILRRKMVVTWWTNIRFEKHFSSDLAKLMKAAGCIAVAGGLEVASDRLLKMMKKGVTVGQVAKVADGLTRAGILVHAYLMYGFPTETEQETVDSLENVRQLFEAGILQSGFWHQFAMTSHSPVGMKPEDYNVKKIGPVFKGFADNDNFHEDAKGAHHERFSKGLSTSLYNYMHGVGYDIPLKKWFDFKIPPTTVEKNAIQKSIHVANEKLNPKSMMIWLGHLPMVEMNEELGLMVFEFHNKQGQWMLECDEKTGTWLSSLFPIWQPNEHEPISYAQFKEKYESEMGGDFEMFWNSDLMLRLRENGLLLI